MLIKPDQMRERLSRWHPNWNVESYPEYQLRAIYNREISKRAKALSNNLVESMKPIKK